MTTLHRHSHDEDYGFYVRLPYSAQAVARCHDFNVKVKDTQVGLLHCIAFRGWNICATRSGRLSRPFQVHHECNR